VTTASILHQQTTDQTQREEEDRQTDSTTCELFVHVSLSAHRTVPCTDWTLLHHDHLGRRSHRDVVVYHSLLGRCRTLYPCRWRRVAWVVTLVRRVLRIGWLLILNVVIGWRVGRWFVDIHLDIIWRGHDEDKMAVAKLGSVQRYLSRNSNQLLLWLTTSPYYNLIKFYPVDL